MFAKLTQELLDAGTDMPAGWEGPSHKRLRPLVEQRLTRIELNQRVVLSAAVGRLYTLRIVADYKPSVIVNAREAREAISIMKIVFEAF